MGIPVGQRTEQSPLTGLRYRSLLAIAILGGMSTAATLVVIHALHATVKDPIRSTASGASARSAKPSAFGTIVTSTMPPDAKLTTPQIAKAGNQAIVTVTGYDGNDQPVSQGIGYVYSPSGIIVTSYTAIRGASSVSVETSSGAVLNVIALMGYSPDRDLAALEVLEGNLPALETGADEIVQEGDSVVVIGADKAVTKGAVGARRAIGGVDLIQITAQAAAGAPVLNEHAKVIGLATHKRLGQENLTLAIPTRYVSDLLAAQHVISFAQMLEETAQVTSARQ